MDVYSTEEEQLKRIKEWLSQYGGTILLSVAIALGGAFGWRYYRSHQENVLGQASMSYEQMMIASMNSDNDKATLQANYLIKQFPQTPYASSAALLLAKLAINANDLPGAEKQLHWVIDHGLNSAVKQTAMIREARVLNAENKPKDALSLLNGITDKPYIAAAAVVKGDAYIALGDKNSARMSYQQALNQLPDSDGTRPYIQMKLSEVAVAIPTKIMKSGENA